MELNHLKYFYYVAREGGFTKASRYMHVAQPAITKMVKTLEASLGFELFDRRGRTIHLTKLGNDLYRKCEIIFGHIEDIKDLNKTRPRELKGQLSFCAAEPIASHFVPPVLKRLLSDHPLIYPQFTAASGAESVRMIIGKTAEFALLFHAPDLPSSVELRASFPVKFHLVVATKCRSSKTICSSFIGSREVDDVANKSYPTLGKLRKKFPAAEIKISTNSLTAHRKMVLDGLGVSILPEYLIRSDLQKNHLTRLLPDEDFRFNMKLISLRGESFSAAAESFSLLLQETLDSL